MTIQQNYFELFGLPQQFAIDESSLLPQYRALQRDYHPDRFAGGSEADKRQALQMSSYINEAYECLRSVRKRAQYLLQLAGVEKNDARTLSDDAFLMQQIEWRERLADIPARGQPLASLDKLKLEVENTQRSLCEDFASRYGAGDLGEAAVLAEKLHFVEKMLAELDILEGRLLDD